MLAAIRGARKTITFETYIYWSGDIAPQFADALAERARQGVKVHVLLDWVGSAKMDDGADRAHARGRHRGAQVPPAALVEAGAAEQPHPPQAAGRRRPRGLHRRCRHRAALDRAARRDPEHWRDTHFQVEGPVVAQMQSVFLDNWIKVTGHVLHGPAYFPELAPAGTQRGADLQQFAQRRQREHAADVPAGAERGDPLDRPVGCLLRAGRADHARRCSRRCSAA